MCTACPANCKTCAWDTTALKLKCSQCYDSYQRTSQGTCDCTSTFHSTFAHYLRVLLLAFSN